VQAGDVVLVASGERVPVDGVVARGETRLDQSIVTGESMPVAVAPGDGAFAGSVNLGPAIELHTRAAGEGTLLAEIARLMEAAERGQGRFVALADRVARLYAPVVHVAGALTFLLWFVVLDAPAHQALLNAAAVLIITCPCALALAVPVVQVVASARLMRSGILMKSATALERLAAIDMVALDKTGTLTQGRPVLVSSPGAEELLLAASMAQASRHPLSIALAAAAPGARLAEGVAERPGEGLALASAEGEVRLGNRAFCGVAGEPASGVDELELWLARPGHEAVRFGFRDELREDAAEAIAALRDRGLELVLLSGDRPAVVEMVAARVGIAAREGGLRPGDKLRRLEELAARGRRVLMAGDGINDAPALAAAHASISPSSAADIARNAADFVFQGARLGAVAEAIDVARAARRLAGQNLLLALAYNLLAVPLAVAGHVTPLVAAVAMSSSSLVVIANALRLSRGRTGP
jgi:Cu2+-exporting ATPase